MIPEGCPASTDLEGVATYTLRERHATPAGISNLNPHGDARGHAVGGITWPRVGWSVGYFLP